jgi:hypothetical protein
MIRCFMIDWNQTAAFLENITLECQFKEPISRLQLDRLKYLLPCAFDESIVVVDRDYLLVESGRPYITLSVNFLCPALFLAH